MNRSTPRQRLERPVAAFCDLVAVLGVVVIVLLLFTGGGLFSIAGHRIRMTSARNPLLFACLCAAVRYVWFRAVPFFGVSRHVPGDADAWLTRRWPARHSGISAGAARAVLAVIIGVSLLLRLVNAVAHPGFSTGDDVEIHMMTLARLLGHTWTAWNLRSPFYPMTFLYPAQFTAFQLGWTDVGSLVLAGRLVVVALATVTVWVVYRIAWRLTSHAPTALLAAAFAACSRLHLWFGGSEFPRPVAAAFIAGAFYLLLVDRRRSVAIAGVLLGIGGSLRFGELLFMVPAALQLFLEQRHRDAVILALAGVATAAIVLGAADWLYWGTPFFSLKNIFDYTVIQGQSSRGYQPLWFYFTNAGEWTSLVVLLLAAIGTWLDRRLAIWVWLPILLLSALPHKEARYMIPVLPIVAVAAAVGVRALLQPAARLAAPALVVFVVSISLLGELSMWRFNRSDAAVALAREIAAMHPSGVASQQSWRLGSPLYWADVDVLVDLPDGPQESITLAPAIDTVVVLHRDMSSQVLRRLQQAGFVEIRHSAAPEYFVARRTAG
jgi:hypothetical protein